MATCNFNNCHRNTYQGEDKCVLHCIKGSYSVDFAKPGFLSTFYSELAQYISDTLSGTDQAPENFNYFKFVEFLKNNDAGQENRLFKSITNVIPGGTKGFLKFVFILKDIFFPANKSIDYFDYKKILNKLRNIHFDSCTFAAHSLELSNANCFYQDCIFFNNWYISNTPILENTNDVLYQQCEFHKNVSSYSENKNRYVLDVSLFNDCEFQEKLEFLNVDFEASLFNNTGDMNLKIHELKLINCNLREKFILNNCDISSFVSEDTVFNSKFEFKNNKKVENFEVFNTNYFKLVDTYGSKFKIFKITKSIFEDFVAFEKCEFGISSNNNSEYAAKFMYATFHSFVNFRNTKFYSGLDIEHINLKESPNFLNTNINPINTNRETFRIIKHSFDKIGNQIEANKFFSHEMDKYREDLKYLQNKKQEKFILFLNKYISNFGQSYICPIFWILVMGGVFCILVLGYENNWLYKIYPPANDAIRYISNSLNNLAKSILPFRKFLVGGMEVVSLFFHIIFAGLIWQTIVAIKRHTRR